jgi:hypothetical protein
VAVEELCWFDDVRGGATGGMWCCRRLSEEEAECGSGEVEDTGTGLEIAASDVIGEVERACE